MVEANGTWFLPEHSTWQLQNLNFMSEQSEYQRLQCSSVCVNSGTRMFPVSMSTPVPAVPGVNPGICMFSTNVATAVPGITGLKEEDPHEVDGLLQQLHPCLPSLIPHAVEKQSMFAFEHNVNAMTNPIRGSLQKGFIIFNRSGNETHLVYSSVLSPAPAHYATTAITKLAARNNLHEGQAVKKDPSLQAFLLEKSGKNYSSANQSEMHEDTEEINALLYSDEEDDYDDEVISTDHSPVATKRKCQMPEQIENVIEEVASSDGLYKRQRLLSGGCKISSSMDIACSVKLDASSEYDSDAESSYAIGQNQTEDTASILGGKLSRKEKIRLAMKILESIIPGAKGKDPLLILDEAIDYLEYLKLGTMALGVNHY
ncbi:hypothetical protein SLA2020_258210 [Shorea laevis]